MEIKDKEYSYKYHGTKEELYEKLNNRNSIYHNCGRPENYLIEIEDDSSFSLGVERAGHSSGHWYNAKVSETDEGLEIRGEIVYKTNGGVAFKEMSLKDKLNLVASVVILLPLFPLLLIVYGIIELYSRFILKRPRPGKEENLDDFMINYLDCSVIDKNNRQT